MSINRTSKAFAAVLLFSFLALLSSCDDDDTFKSECKGLFADFTAELIAGGIDTMFVGQPTNLSAIIHNVSAVAYDCVIAGNPNAYRVHVYYDSSIDPLPNDQYYIGGKTYNLNQNIEPGQQITNNLYLTFNQAGNYLLAVAVDPNNVTPEWDENNNGADVNFGDNDQSNVFRVSVDAKGQFEVEPNAPIVIFH